MGPASAQAAAKVPDASRLRVSSQAQAAMLAASAPLRNWGSPLVASTHPKLFRRREGRAGV
jgi:hypothetical protein